MFHSRRYDEALASTMVVNMLCVLEIFYLFNVRYLHMRSCTWAGARGTLALGLACMVLLEVEKALPRRWQVFQEPGSARAAGPRMLREQTE